MQSKSPRTPKQIGKENSSLKRASSGEVLTPLTSASRKITPKVVLNMSPSTTPSRRKSRSKDGTTPTVSDCYCLWNGVVNIISFALSRHHLFLQLQYLLFPSVKRSPRPFLPETPPCIADPPESPLLLPSRKSMSLQISPERGRSAKLTLLCSLGRCLMQA